MIKFRCQACGKKIGVPESAAGRRVACPSCKQAVSVPASETKLEPELDPLMPDLDAIEAAGRGGASAAVQTGQAASRTCPSCHKPVGEDAVLCVNCGTPLRAGMKRQKTTVAADTTGRGRQLAGSAAGLVVAAIVAGVFSLIWVGLVIFTGYEFGVLAWGLGGLIGLTAGAIAKNPSPIFGGLAATLALGSILGAKLIVASLIFLAAVGVNFVSNLAAYSPENQKIYHAVLEEMITEGALEPSQLSAAQSAVAVYFTGEPAEVDQAAVDWEKQLEVDEAIQTAVTARIETMSEEEQLAAVERARQRHPDWIEDPNLYLAVADDMVSRHVLPAELERHAQSELVSLDGGQYDDEYYQSVSPRDQESRQRELRGRVVSQIAGMSSDQKKAAIEAARARHPRWIVDEKLHFAVLAQVVEEGVLTGDVQQVAQADVASTMDQEWDQPAFEKHEWEKLADLQGQATAVVNNRIQGMSEQQRIDAIAAAEAAHPNWGNALGFDADEVEHALLQEGVDGSFASAVRASFSLFDLLWVGLAVTTAFSVAVKQGE